MARIKGICQPFILEERLSNSRQRQPLLHYRLSKAIKQHLAALGPLQLAAVALCAVGVALCAVGFVRGG